MHEHTMLKHLSKVGNSSALVLDRTLMELVDLTPGAAVDIQVHDGALVIRPLSQRQRQETVAEASEAIMDRFAETFRKLAQ
jgi:antitoxin component of MazEF toxin-antitoxin module